MSITFSSEWSSKAEIHVQKSWAGNAVTGQLVKEFMKQKGSYQNVDKYMKNCEVTVIFSTQLLIAGSMSTAMVAAVLEDVLTMDRDTKKVMLIWV